MVKAALITQLEKEILSLQGLKPVPQANHAKLLPAIINKAFPNHVFPTGAIHEFCCADKPAMAATNGFIGGVLQQLMQQQRACLWVSHARNIFPPALHAFGIDPSRIIFIDLAKEKQVLWVIEEALKCKGLAAVVGEINTMDFTASRRLQLAVEQSRVTGFLLRPPAATVPATASVARWQISSIASQLDDGMPGIGFPRWKVDLLKIRNGQPGTWELEWKDGRFVPVVEEKKLPQLLHSKTA